MNKLLEKIKYIIDEIWYLVSQTIKEWLDDNMMLHAAGLAFYTIFSLAPLLLIIIAISGFIFGEQASSGQLAVYMEEVLGKDLANAIQSFVNNVSSTGPGLLTTIISTSILVFAATTVLTQLKESLNTIWNVKAEKGQGIKIFVVNRLLALILILIFSFTLAATIFIDAILSLIGPYLDQYVPQSLGVWKWINTFFFLLVTTLLFTIIYKMLPDITVKWTDVLVGAFVTALLFLLGRNLVGIYLATAAQNSAFGAAGSFVIFLIWVYYNMMVIFLGAEFTQIYTKRYGSKIRPGRFVKWAKNPSV